MKSHFELLANYNRWMNESIYSAAAQLDEALLAKDQGAFFCSILGTLNHILVGDTFWLKRFAVHPHNFRSLEYMRSLDNPDSLDAILYSELAALAAERIVVDKVILQFAQELSENDISSPLSYKNTRGQPFVKNMGFLLLHFFNHQTHHRGQVSTLLSQNGVDVGTTDLLLGIPDADAVSR